MDDANDEVPVFTQQQYNRLGLRETAGIGTSVIVVRATDPDTGESRLSSVRRREQTGWSLTLVLVLVIASVLFSNLKQRDLADCHESVVCSLPTLTLVGATEKGVTSLNQNFFYPVTSHWHTKKVDLKVYFCSTASSIHFPWCEVFHRHLMTHLVQ